MGTVLFLLVGGASRVVGGGSGYGEWSGVQASEQEQAAVSCVSAEWVC